MTINSLDDGTVYYVAIAALNNIGEGAQSSFASASTFSVPEMMTFSVHEGGETVVHLEWSAPSDGGSPITGYTVYRGLSIGTIGYWASFASDVTAYDNSAVTNGTTYYYQISATNAIGEGPLSDPIERHPVRPAVGTARSACEHRIRPGTESVSAPVWNADIDHYRVFRGTSAGNEVFIGNASGNSCASSSLASDARYYYEVSAVDGNGEGPQSAEDFQHDIRAARRSDRSYRRHRELLRQPDLDRAGAHRKHTADTICGIPVHE